MNIPDVTCFKMGAAIRLFLPNVCSVIGLSLAVLGAGDVPLLRVYSFIGDSGAYGHGRRERELKAQ